jgi:hypothetical protein
MTTMKIIAERDNWRLLDRDKTSNGWISIKLEACGGRYSKRGKRNWWMGWNGERLARNTDTKLLAEDYPDIHEWAIEQLRPYQPAVSVTNALSPSPVTNGETR